MMKLKEQTETLSAQTIIKRAGIKKGMHVAEIGTGGDGHVVFPVAKKVGEEGRVYAIEVQKNLLDLLERRSVDMDLHNVDFIHAHAELINGTTLPNNTVDRIIYVNTMHQMDNKENALTEAARILKQDGEILIIDWGKQKGCPHPSLKNYCFDPEDLAPIWKKANLVHIDTFDVSPYYWGTVLKHA